MAKPTVLLGPILHIDDCTIANWNFRIDLLLTPESGTSDAPPPVDLITFDDADVVVREPKLVADLRDLPLGQLWSYSVSVPRLDVERSIAYTINLERPRRIDGVAIPARTQLPRIAGFSCNGFSGPGARAKVADRPFAMWERVSALHLGEPQPSGTSTHSPIHLLIGGGDQIYSDELQCVKTLFEKLKRNDLSVPHAFAEEAWNEFPRAYLRHFKRSAIADMLERIPSVMTWDDHEICDGYGSQGEKWQSNPWFEPIYEAARRCFCAFQLGVDPKNPTSTILYPRAPEDRDGHFMQWVYLPCEGAEIDILLLDLRSGRTNKRILSDQQETHLWNALNGFAKRSGGVRRHLIVVSSIPLVFAKHNKIDALLKLLPEKHELIDDLLDHWEHHEHKAEQQDVLRRLFAHREANEGSVVIFSGDVHSATCLELRPNEKVTSIEQAIFQIVSSGIVHPPPLDEAPEFIEYVLMDADGRKVMSGVKAKLADLMEKVPTFLSRNFALVEFAPNSFTARWRLEVEDRGSTRTLDVPAVERRATT